MKQFFVGQRVRFIANNNPKCIHKVGDVGVVTALPGSIGSNPFVSAMLKVLGADMYEVDMPTGTLYAPAKHLAPVYDGDQPGTWDECVWQPEPEEAEA